MKGDTNFGLFVIGVIAVVALAGMLNFDGISGKAVGSVSTSEIIDSTTGVTYYCSPDCNNKCSSSCITTKVKAGTSAAGNAPCTAGLPDAEGYYSYSFCG